MASQPLQELKVVVDAGPPALTTTAVVYPAVEARAALVLAHGAGAGQRSAFMVGFASGLAHLGLDVVTFNFFYAEQGRRLPDRMPLLERCYAAVVDVVRRELPSARRALFIGGKSMGGRVATHLGGSDRAGHLAGLVLLGYPLHPLGRPDRRRDAHLSTIGLPMLFVQGSRDGFGGPEELAPVLDAMRPRPTLYAVDGGDHSFTLPARRRAEQVDTYRRIQDAIAEWTSSTRGV